MRPERPARPADQVGTVERDGVTIAYQVRDGPAVERGNGGPTVVLMPTWSIVPSRMWKAQVPYLARHFRVITFDGRGSGASSKPVGAAAYAEAEYVADTLAVLDATGVTECVLVGFSRGAPWALQVAAAQPGRVRGVVCVGSAPGLLPDPKGLWSERQPSSEGWAKYNRHYWQEGGYEDFLEFFFGQVFNEPHSSKQIEDSIRWGRQIGPDRLVDTEAARQAQQPSIPAVQCPVLIVHGTDDPVRPFAEAQRLAEVTGGTLVTVEGGGHAPHARDPVFFNRLLKDFIATSQPVRRTWVRALNRPRRALYLSSPIGLGHAKRDLAIAQELRVLRPELQLDWLAQHPVTRVLQDAGETVHPASGLLISEAAHVDFEADDHDLHAFQAIRRMDEILVANFLTFADLVDDRYYDLVIADEAWEVDYFLHENPELKHFSYAWLTDFIGWLPMPDGGPAEAALTADYNAEMLEHRARYPRLRDHSIFVGDPEDIVTTTFGQGLPSIRDWATTNYTFTGYITPPTAPVTRQDLGYRTNQLLCVVTVGGSAAGQALLHRVLDAVPLARRLVPGLDFVFVTGPRIDPTDLPPTEGVTTHGYLPNLNQHLAVADLAITQGGLSTCMELTALHIPFIYVPLEHHFEQNFHVRARLDRHNAGQHLPYEAARNPQLLAEAIAKQLTHPIDYLPIPTNAAVRAATLLNELL
ncbi:alpha/beta fold hydrolase [Kribbella sp. NPDC051718]|uniref:alpha/beta fold hydrolase n=1 Tax=Kribbella sp. NPDC051718 TaxID=3155168 RepID=UPI00342C7FC0